MQYLHEKRPSPSFPLDFQTFEEFLHYLIQKLRYKRLLVEALIERGTQSQFIFPAPNVELYTPVNFLRVDPHIGYFDCGSEGI